MRNKFTWSDMRIGIISPQNLDDHLIKIINPIIEDADFDIVLALVDARKKPSIKKKIVNYIKKGKMDLIIVAFFRYLLKQINNPPCVDAVKFFEERGIPTIQVNKFTSPKIAEEVKKRRIDVLVLLWGFVIIKEPLLTSTPIGVLSYHHGNIRKYRGIPIGFWQLYNGEKDMGITVQILSSEIDSGIPVVEKTVNIKPGETLGSLRKKLFEEDIELMYLALKKLKKISVNDLKKVDRLGPLYTHPRIYHYIILYIKIICRKIKFLIAG